MQPSIFAASTFGFTAWYRLPLSPATVIVCLSLFGIIIQPLNSLPWVPNGVLRPGCLLSLPPLTSSTVKSKTQPGNRKHNHDTRTVKKCPVLRLPPGCEA